MAIDIKPEGWECHGPCRQGRAECPTPHACERPDDTEDTFRLLGQAAIAVVLAAVAALILGVLR